MNDADASFQPAVCFEAGIQPSCTSRSPTAPRAPPPADKPFESGKSCSTQQYDRAGGAVKMKLVKLNLV
jgi:hypothetical protein